MMKWTKAAPVAALIALSGCDDSPKYDAETRHICGEERAQMVEQITRNCGVGKYPEDCIWPAIKSVCPAVWGFSTMVHGNPRGWLPCTEAKTADQIAACALVGAHPDPEG